MLIQLCIINISDIGYLIGYIQINWILSRIVKIERDIKKEIKYQRSYPLPFK